VLATAAPLGISLTQLKHRFGDVYPDDHAAGGLNIGNAGCSIHLGLLRVGRRPPHHMKAGWHIDAAKTRGSPSHQFNADAKTGHAFGILLARFGALRASRSGAG